jgi:lysophospholipase L1-like esterase
VNLGVPGDTSETGLLRVEEVIIEDPGIAIVLLGGNDALRRVPLEETRTNLTEIVRTIRENGTLVILVGVRGGILGDPYDEMYEEVAEAEGTAFVPNVLAGILGKADLTYDQIHPNDAGYEMVAERIYEVLKEYL